MTDMTDTSPEMTAIHEAGHAVMAELLWMNPEYVTIEPNEDGPGHLRRRRILATAIDKWRDLLVLCAGVIAEAIHSEDFDLWIELESLGDESLSDEGSDSAQLWASLAAYSDDQAQQSEWFNLAIRQTERILTNPAVWRSVGLLADRLLTERTIQWGTSAEIISEGLRRSKWETDRVRMTERYAKPPATWPKDPWANS